MAFIRKDPQHKWICQDCMFELYGLENLFITPERMEQVKNSVEKLPYLQKDWSRDYDEFLFPEKAGFQSLSMDICDSCEQPVFGTIYRFLVVKNP